jgi:hypothetical protein
MVNHTYDDQNDEISPLEKRVREIVKSNMDPVVRVRKVVPDHQDPYVTKFLNKSADTYKERNAVYKDNYLMVGRVMKALFPNGAPPLVTEEDYNRWHLFELAIVKLTRYVISWDNPHQDSLEDMIVYLAMVGGRDEVLRKHLPTRPPAVGDSDG